MAKGDEINRPQIAAVIRVADFALVAGDCDSSTQLNSHSTPDFRDERPIRLAPTE
jgi:hypothetical protein